MVRIWDGLSSNRFLLPGCWNVILAATLLIVAVTQIHSVQSISNEEKAALAEILIGHPDLRSVPSWRQLTDDGNYYGRSWQNITSDVCSRDGYDIYGVYCQGGSVVGLRITEAFGLPALSSFPAVSGLVNLKNLNGISISDFPNLRYLKFWNPDATRLDSPQNSLEELHFSRVSCQTIFSKLGNFPALTVLECACTGSQTVAPELNSDQLKSLTLSAIYSSIPPIVSGKNLEVLEAYQAKVTLGDLPSLKYLSCASISNQTGILPQKLQTLVLRGNNWNLESLEAVACPLIRSSNSSIESLTISSTSVPISVVPACITEPQLKYLELSQLKLANSSSASTFQASLPLSLTGLSLSYCQPGLSLNAFIRLRNLETLDVSSYTWVEQEITPDFTTFTSNLRTLKLNANALRGRITTIGGPKLEVLELNLGITQWDGLESSPNLKILRIESSRLQSLPSDDIFLRANLTSLKVFAFRSYTCGPVPTFWVNLATLTSLSITANYSGQLPNELALPRLQNLEVRNIIRPDVICGSLPNFLVPTHLRSLSLHTSSISGTIPASWEQNLTILERIKLQNTLISGTIPQHLFDHHTIQLLQIRFSNTFVGGNLWDSLRFMPQQMDFTNTLLSLSCPPLPSPRRRVSAIFVNISSCPQDLACIQAWKAATSNFDCSIQTDRVLPQIGTCNMVPRCPTPAPSNPPPKSQTPSNPPPKSQTPSNLPPKSQVPSLEPTTNSSLVNHASQLAVSLVTMVAVSMIALLMPL